MDTIYGTTSPRWRGGIWLTNLNGPGTPRCGWQTAEGNHVA
ncbi:hypothetical protein [Comamonas serinivorans]|nr:hypothetical protein [Comamonas serinivorans]